MRGEKEGVEHDLLYHCRGIGGRGDFGEERRSDSGGRPLSTFDGVAAAWHSDWAGKVALIRFSNS